MFPPMVQVEYNPNNIYKIIQSVFFQNDDELYYQDGTNHGFIFKGIYNGCFGVYETGKGYGQSDFIVAAVISDTGGSDLLVTYLVNTKSNIIQVSQNVFYDQDFFVSCRLLQLNEQYIILQNDYDVLVYPSYYNKIESQTLPTFQSCGNYFGCQFQFNVLSNLLVLVRVDRPIYTIQLSQPVLFTNSTPSQKQGTVNLSSKNAHQQFDYTFIAPDDQTIYPTFNHIQTQLKFTSLQRQNMTVDLSSYFHGPNITYTVDSTSPFPIQQQISQSIQSTGVIFSSLYCGSNSSLYYQVNQFSNLSIVLNQCQQSDCTYLNLIQYNQTTTLLTLAEINTTVYLAVYSTQSSNEQSIQLYQASANQLNSFFINAPFSITIQDIQFAGQYFYVVTGILPSLQVYQLINNQFKFSYELQGQDYYPRKLYTSPQLFGPTVFLDNTMSLITFITVNGEFFKYNETLYPSSSIDVDIGITEYGVYITLISSNSSQIYLLPTPYLLNPQLNRNVEFAISQVTLPSSVTIQPKIVSTYSDDFYMIVAIDVNGTYLIILKNTEIYLAPYLSSLPTTITAIKQDNTTVVGYFNQVSSSSSLCTLYNRAYLTIEPPINALSYVLFNLTTSNTHYSSSIPVLVNFKPNTNITNIDINNVTIDSKIQLLNSSINLTNLTQSNIYISFEPQLYFSGAIENYYINCSNCQNASILNPIQYTSSNVSAIPLIQSIATLIRKGTSQQIAFVQSSNLLQVYDQFNNTFLNVSQPFTNVTCLLVFIYKDSYPVSICSNSIATYAYAFDQYNSKSTFPISNWSTYTFNVSNTSAAYLVGNTLVLVSNSSNDTTITPFYFSSTSNQTGQPLTIQMNPNKQYTFLDINSTDSVQTYAFITPENALDSYCIWYFQTSQTNTSLTSQVNYFFMKKQRKKTKQDIKNYFKSPSIPKKSYRLFSKALLQQLIPHIMCQFYLLQMLAPSKQLCNLMLRAILMQQTNTYLQGYPAPIQKHIQLPTTTQLSAVSQTLQRMQFNSESTPNPIRKSQYYQIPQLSFNSSVEPVQVIGTYNFTQDSVNFTALSGNRLFLSNDKGTFFLTVTQYAWVEVIPYSNMTNGINYTNISIFVSNVISKQLLILNLSYLDLGTPYEVEAITGVTITYVIMLVVLLGTIGFLCFKSQGINREAY